MTQNNPETAAMRAFQQAFAEEYRCSPTDRTAKTRLSNGTVNVRFNVLYNFLLFYLRRFESHKISEVELIVPTLKGGTQVIQRPSRQKHRQVGPSSADTRLSIGADRTDLFHYLTCQLTKVPGNVFTTFPNPSSCRNLGASLTPGPEYPSSVATRCEPCLFGFKRPATLDEHS